MTTATLPPLADIELAARDVAYYDKRVEQLTGDALTAFETAVNNAYQAASAPLALTPVEQRMLAFEHRHFANPGRREQAIRDEFGISATRYYQRLNWLIDEPAAQAADPILVNRLRSLRAQRQARRSNHTAARRGAA